MPLRNIFEIWPSGAAACLATAPTRDTGKELVQISVDLIEKAEVLEGYFSIAEPTSNPDDLFKAEIIDVGEDEKD